MYQKFLGMKIVDYDVVEFKNENAFELFELLRKTINCKGFVVICYSSFDILIVNYNNVGMVVKGVCFSVSKRCYYYKFLDYIMINCERTDMLNKCFGSYLKDYYIPKVIYV